MKLTSEDKYQLLKKISHQTRDTLNLDQILNHILDLIMPVIYHDAGGIFVVNQDFIHNRRQQPGEVIAGVVMRGFYDRPPEQDPMRSLGIGIVGSVIRTGVPIVIEDVRLDARYIEGRKQTLSEITIPIVRHEKTIGALNLESDSLGAFTAEDVEILEFFADAASISIEKAMLHEQLLEKEQLDAQLKNAQAVQNSLLPACCPVFPGYEIQGVSVPTNEIGGDYYDFIELGKSQVGIVIADVSGHGIPAALVMAAFRTLLRAQAYRKKNPGQIARSINRMLPESTGNSSFVTAIYGVLDFPSGLYTYTNCGHPHPFIVTENGNSVSLEVHGPALGVFPEKHYSTGSISLTPGDTLVLYTDGASELQNSDGDFYTNDRLVSLVRNNRNYSASEQIDLAIRDMRNFSGLQSFNDDLTMVIVQRNDH